MVHDICEIMQLLKPNITTRTEKKMWLLILKPSENDGSDEKIGNIPPKLVGGLESGGMR